MSKQANGTGSAIFIVAIALLLVLPLAGCGAPDADRDTESAEAEQPAAADSSSTTKAPVVVTQDGAEASPNAPAIYIEMKEFDMGEIVNDQSTVAEVAVYNRGNAPLIISGVKTQCGCTKGRMASSTIAPGESENLIITVDPFRIPGFSSTKMLTLSSNDPVSPKTYLNVHATVEKEVEVEPEVLDFGEVRKGQGAEITLRVRQLNDEPLEIRSAGVQARKALFEVEYEPVPESEWRTPGKREYLVTARVLPSAPMGQLLSRLAIVTNNKRLRNLPVAIRGQVTGSYSIRPSLVRIRNVGAGETRENVLTITAKTDLTAELVGSDNEYLTVTQHPGATPNSVAFDIAISAGAQNRLIRDIWSLKITAGGEQFTERINVLVLLSNPDTARITSSAKGSAPVQIQRSVQP